MTSPVTSEDAAWDMLCQRLGRDPATSEEDDTCSLRAAWKAMLAFARHREASSTPALDERERLRSAVEQIAADGPVTDPGPAFDDGWVSHGNYDDVAYDSRQEVCWAHAQIARSALASIRSGDAG